MATFSIFFANAVMYSLHDHDGPFRWCFAIGIQLLWAGLVAISTALAPELPRYYVQRGNIDQARANLSKLRGLEQEDPELLAEMAAIQQSVDDERLAANATYADCFRSKDRMLMRTMNGILIQFVSFASSSVERVLTLLPPPRMGQQWTGVNFFVNIPFETLEKLELTLNSTHSSVTARSSSAPLVSKTLSRSSSSSPVSTSSVPSPVFLSSTTSAAAPSFSSVPLSCSLFRSLQVPSRLLSPEMRPGYRFTSPCVKALRSLTPDKNSEREGERT
jgi:hypothetical protein